MLGVAAVGLGPRWARVVTAATNVCAFGLCPVGLWDYVYGLIAINIRPDAAGKLLVPSFIPAFGSLAVGLRHHDHGKYSVHFGLFKCGIRAIFAQPHSLG